MPLTEREQDEMVLCVRDVVLRAAIDSGGQEYGFIPARAISLGRLTGLLNKADAFSYQPRSTCETDPTFRQFCTYSVISRRGMVLSYERGARGGEPRLHVRRSIGIGGHINIRDTDECESVDAFYRAATREIQEEITFSGGLGPIRYAGLLYDNSDDVGRVHVGLVFEAACNGAATDCEPAIVNPCFVNLHHLDASMFAEYEGWSKILLRAMVPTDSRDHPTLLE